MLPGIAAIALMLPGLIYIFVVALVFGFVDKFAHLSGAEVSILAGISILAIVVDQLAGIIGAKWGGARFKSFIYGIVGVLVGTLLLPPFGGFIGLFIGILIGELMGKRDRKQAVKAATAGVIGTISGVIVNFCLSIIFVGLFIWFAIS